MNDAKETERYQYIHTYDINLSEASLCSLLQQNQSVVVLMPVAFACRLLEPVCHHPIIQYWYV